MVGQSASTKKSPGSASVQIKSLGIHLGITLLSALIVTGCRRPEAADSPTVQDSPAIRVSTVALSRTKVEITEDLPGRVVSVRTADIRPQVSGIVQHRLFDQGGEITAGQPLFQINPAPFQADVEMAAAALQKAEAALDRAKLQEKRLQPLAKADAVSQQVYDDAVAQRDQAAAEVAQATAALTRRQLDLKFATVEAPISGRIDQALVTEGALVGPSDAAPMARIQQLDQVYVDVRQPASLFEQLRGLLAKPENSPSNGLPIVILRNDGAAFEMTGRILFSGVSVAEGTGDVLLRILVDNPHRQLLPGLFVRARVQRASYPNTLQIPQQAVLRTGGQANVWIIDEASHAHSIPVEVGELVNHNYLIRSGIEAGQKVVVEGMDRLSEDALVSSRDWHAATPQ